MLAFANVALVVPYIDPANHVGDVDESDETARRGSVAAATPDPQHAGNVSLIAQPGGYLAKCDAVVCKSFTLCRQPIYVVPAIEK
eukprot:scaffold39407_cov18-Prasinocladus_malaysianus.AAC.2